MRTWANCGETMVEGYLLEDLGVTFCSNDCLDRVFPGSSTDIMKMTEEELDNSTWYWTSWEEEDEDGSESSSTEISYEDIVRAAEGKPAKKVFTMYNPFAWSESEIPDVQEDVQPNKYHYEDYEDGTYFEDGE